MQMDIQERKKTRLTHKKKGCINMIRVASFNISGGFYIGNENTEYLDRKSASSIDNELQNQIIDLINSENIDVICFQEIITTKEIKYLDDIANKTNLKFYDYFELSPNNLVENTNSGIAIFSKYPIKTLKKGLFPNPKLAKTTSSGNTYYTFDKGYIISEIDFNNKKVTLLTHHGFPYRRFNSTPESNSQVFNFFDEVIINNNVDIVTGDFNSENFMNLMPKTNNMYKRTINDITTVDGMKFDDILVYKNINYSKKIIKLISDHYVVIDDLNI